MIDIRISSKVGFSSSMYNNNFVILNTALTDDLLNEGLARETISKIQQERKNMNFDIIDRINMYIDSTSEYKERINDSTDDMIILSSQYFSPKSYETGKISLTNKTICIHHYSGSWLPWQKRVKLMIKHFLGKKTIDFFRFIRNRI